MNNPEFLKDPTYGYPEVGICLEDTTDCYCKMYIPNVTPFVEHENAFDKKDTTYQTKTIKSLNKNKLNISPCTESNYVSLHLPDTVTKASKGDRFILGFVNADVNKPFIIGRYYG